MVTLALLVWALAARHALAAPAPDATVSSAASSTSVGTQVPSSPPKLGSITAQGCFSSKGNLVLQSQPTWNSFDGCGAKTCAPLGKKVSATSGGSCYCGDEYPPLDAVVADSQCHSGCPGFPSEACGGGDGSNLFSVYNDGLDINVQYMANSSNPTTSSSSAASSSTPTATSSSASSGNTVFVTQTPTTTSTTAAGANSGSSGGGSNVVGIAVGVVVGVIVVAAIVGVLFYCLRRRRNLEIEEEHRRNAAVNAFFSGTKPPSSSGGLSITDSRLDPVMAHRRLSDGSIADNQDYSRKILRVTNA